MCSAVSRPCRGAWAPCRKVPVARCVVRRAAPCCSAYPAVSQGLLAVSWPCVAACPHAAARRIAGLFGRVARITGRIVALPGRVARPCCAPRPTVSRYNLLYHDPYWKMGSSPFSLLYFFLFCFFFHSYFFFHFVPPTGKPHKKKQFFFSFPVNSKIFFFKHLFFSCFTHCKTSEKIFSTHFFYSSSSLLSTP